MEKLKDLRALLVHEVMDVYSAEEQILKALPMMIEKASNAKLKASLKDHLKVTRTQKQRLDKVQELLKVSEEQKGKGKKGGLFGLFGGGQKCKGMEGIITEGNSIMKEDIDPEVLDAAIIASCQKVEHYEICAYGTLKAYANELGLAQVVKLLDETLAEEYEADVLLTELAVFGGLNQKAEVSGPSAKRTDSKGASARRAAPATNSRSASTPSKSSSPAKKSSSSPAKKSSASNSGTAKKASTSKR